MSSAVARTLNGSVDDLVLLASVADLLQATNDTDSWTLAGSAVARIVEQYSRGDISAAQAREWAFFVRHGFSSTATLPVMPIDIDWEPAREDAIAEATSRLEELGDVVDGELAPGEAKQLVRLLIE